MNNDQISLSSIYNFSEKQKQATAIADRHKFTLYGGAAGGGKSYWLRWYSLRWLILMYQKFGYKNLVGALFCEDYPTLKDRHVGKLEIEVPKWMGELKDTKAYGLCVKLSKDLGEGVLLLRNLDDPSKYMSTEFALIGIDELTMNNEDVFTNLRARLRWPGLAHTKFISGSNPGNRGHEWVRKRWITRDFPPEEKESNQFAYVPATVDDNPYIDPGYLLTLESLPEKKRKALREGSWDIFEGQFFTEFEKERHVVPTVERKNIPASWKRIRSIDVSGKNGTTSCHWYAIDNDKNVWVYQEHYASGFDSDEHAEFIWHMSHYVDEYGDLVPEDYVYTVMDSSAWDKMGHSETTAEIYLRKWQELDMEHNVSVGQDSLIPSHKQRIMGWDVVHQYLRWYENDINGKLVREFQPKLRIMENCVNLIRTLPLAVTDKHNPLDVNTDGEDHALDDLRYCLVTLRGQGSPRSETPAEKKVKQLAQQKLDQMRARMLNYRKN